MILLRHGQSEFNLHFSRTRIDPGIIDPPLTALGHAQAEAAAEALARHGIRRIITSPYTRALQTALPLARRLGLAVQVSTLVRERFAFSCDIGRPASVMAREFPEIALDHLEEVWWPAEDEPQQSVRERAARFRAELAAREDWAHTVVVTHWGFIMACTGLSLGNGDWVATDPREPPPEEVSWRHH
ncbi:MAG: histidine phosphatase family protein [Rhodovarius sp.]|nr:phosphoglycerate mutase family protein [Rhodovarius sp.]MCX7931316.1 phosphoglycerate mutase family protein [Rhodovarius sp.]MDW8315837.1 histidine phosphatase family protein [Rhodovarius sp.]